MNKIKNKIILLILSELFIIFTITACVENSPFDYSTSDVIEYLAEVFPNENIEIKNGSRFSRKWECYFTDLPDVVFQVETIKSHSLGPIPISKYVLHNNAQRILCQYWSVVYKSNGNKLDIWEEVLENPEASFGITYKNRKEAASAITQFRDFYNWVVQQPHGKLVENMFPEYSFQPESHYIAAAVNACTDYECQTSVIKWNETDEEILECCEEVLLEYGAFLNLSSTGYSSEELEEYAKNRWDWEGESIMNMGEFYLNNNSISRNTFYGIGYDILSGEPVVTYGGLYEILTRLNMTPVGTPEHFYFTGVDGRQYEFSYDFLKEIQKEGSNGISWIERTWYYLRNGIKITISEFSEIPVISIKSNIFKSMTGISLLEYTSSTEIKSTEPSIRQREDGTWIITGDKVDFVWNEETQHNDYRIWNNQTNQWTLYIWNEETKQYERQLEIE